MKITRVCLFLGLVALQQIGCSAGSDVTQPNNGSGNNNNTTSGIVFAGSYNHGIFRTSNLGSSWSKVAALTAYPYNFAWNSTHVFAAIAGKGMMRSSDNGLTWQFVNAGL